MEIRRADFPHSPEAATRDRSTCLAGSADSFVCCFADCQSARYVCRERREPEPNVLRRTPAQVGNLRNSRLGSCATAVERSKTHTDAALPVAAYGFYQAKAATGQKHGNST